MKKWFLSKRVLPRWKLILLVFIGIWCGFVIDTDPYFAIMFSFLMIWELLKNKS